MVSAVMMTGTVSAQSINSNDDNDNSVAVGYGTMSKDDITSCITSVKAEDLGKVANADALQGLQAKVPGVDIQQVSGEAGAGISILLRGYRSFMANKTPLIIVDGAEYLSTFDIPASEIESISILKDAASTAIYGAKAANGVVIVNTKRGKAGKINVNFDAYWSFNSSTAPVKGMYGNREVQRWIDSDNYINDYRSGNWGESNVTAHDFGYQTLEDGTLINDMIANGEFTDWLGLLQKNSVSQNYDVSVGGGNQKTRFNVALSMMDDRGMTDNDQFKRYRAHGNIDHEISRIFKIGASISYTHIDKDRSNSGVFESACKLTSLAHAYDSQTKDLVMFPDIWNYSYINPLIDFKDNNIGTKHFFGNAYLQINPFRGFEWQTRFNYDYIKREDKLRNTTYNGFTKIKLDDFELSATNYIIQNTAKYSHCFNGIHDLGIMIGNEYTHYDTDEESSSLSTFQSYYDSEGSEPSNIFDYSYQKTHKENSALSFFGRANYSYAGKYLFQATFRADGYSVFSGERKWSTYPSVSAGWRITGEKFMQGTKSWLDNLKLRMSWGVAGSGIENLFLSNIKYLGTSGVSYEKTSTFEIGIDFALLNGRLGGSIDYYASRTYDLLYYLGTGFKTAYSYIPIINDNGKSKGHGFEISLNAVPVLTKDFRWDVSASATFAKDEIVELANGVEKAVADNTAAFIGQPISTYYDYEVGNCWGVGEYEQYCADYKARTGKDFNAPNVANYKDDKTGYGTPGTIKIIDLNDDGMIDYQDRRIYQRLPKAILGMTNTFSYKNFTLSILMMARLGGYMAYEKNAYVGGSFGYENWADVNYWTPTNTDTKFPSPGVCVMRQNLSASVLQYEKADYFKIKDITLSYNLEKNWLKSLRMENATVYCSLKNFITVNALDDNYDPERGGAISFPLSKQFVLGLNVTF